MNSKRSFFSRRHSSKLPIIVEEKDLLLTTRSACGTLPIDSYFDWFNAIIYNDIEYVTSRLESSTETDSQHLLDGTFDYNDVTGLKLKGIQGHSLKISKPLCLAAAFGANAVMKIFLQSGANVEVIDSNGYNIVHCIIAFSVFESERETVNVKTYQTLVNELNPEIIKRLLFQENDQKLRPVEMAAQCGAFNLLESIFETDGVYVTKTEKKGLYNYRWIDITEYETYNKDNRRTKSPLFFLTLLDQRDLKRPSTQEVFKRPLVVKWMNGKFNCSKPGVFVWAFLRLAFVTVYFLQDSINMHSRPSNEEKTNGTTSTDQPSPTDQQRLNVADQNIPSAFHLEYCKFYMYFFIPENVIFGMIIYLLIHSAGILLFDIWDIARRNYIKMKWLLEDLRGSRQLVVHYVFYRTCQFMMAFFTAIVGIVSLTKSSLNIVSTDLMHIMTAWSCLWSVMFFVQLEPSIGHFVVIVQRMIKDMFRFITVFFLCFLPFPHVFYKLVTSGQECRQTGVFTSPLLTYYGTWGVMLNMVDLTSHLEHIPDPLALMLLHMIYVFLVGVLLINFLIALFSNTVAEVLTYKKIIIKIQRISVILCLEDRLGPWLGSLYKRRQEKCPYFHCEDDRIYIIEPFKNYHKGQPLVTLTEEY